MNPVSEWQWAVVSQEIAFVCSTRLAQSAAIMSLNSINRPTIFPYLDPFIYVGIGTGYTLGDR
jgi:hypothetical protein